MVAVARSAEALLTDARLFCNLGMGTHTCKLSSCVNKCPHSCAPGGGNTHTDRHL